MSVRLMLPPVEYQLQGAAADPRDVVMVANMCHVSPWAASQGLCRGLAPTAPSCTTIKSTLLLHIQPSHASLPRLVASQLALYLVPSSIMLSEDHHICSTAVNFQILRKSLPGYSYLLGTVALHCLPCLLKSPLHSLAEQGLSIAQTH